MKFYYCLLFVFMSSFSVANAQTVSKLIDQRMFKHWTQAQITQMQLTDPKKIKKIEYMLNDSWRVPSGNQPYFDVYDYNQSRKENAESLIYLKELGGRPVYLQSWVTVRAAWARL